MTLFQVLYTALLYFLYLIKLLNESMSRYDVIVFFVLRTWILPLFPHVRGADARSKAQSQLSLSHTEKIRH